MTRQGPADAVRPTHQYEEILERFEETWQSSPEPDINHYLPPPGDLDRAALLLELVHIDLERRWKAGEQPWLESYLQRYPELKEDLDALFELILAEYDFHCRFEGRPGFAEYGRRFRELRSGL